MNICVCVKQVPASNETRLDPVTHTVIREGAESILNPFDAFAVEEAVRLKARFGGRISAFSMGIPAVSEMLRRVIAVGADEAYLLSDRAFAGADTIATARALAAAPAIMVITVVSAATAAMIAPIAPPLMAAAIPSPAINAARIALIAAIAFIMTAIRPISPAEIAGIIMFQPPSVSVPAANTSTRSAAPL